MRQRLWRPSRVRLAVTQLAVQHHAHNVQLGALVSPRQVHQWFAVLGTILLATRRSVRCVLLATLVPVFLLIAYHAQPAVTVRQERQCVQYALLDMSAHGLISRLRRACQVRTPHLKALHRARLVLLDPHAFQLQAILLLVALVHLRLLTQPLAAIVLLGTLALAPQR